MFDYRDMRAAWRYYMRAGDEISITGDSGKNYVLEKREGVCSCSCPAWKFCKGELNQKTCKHLKKYRGEAREEMRIQDARSGRKILRLGDLSVGSVFRFGLVNDRLMDGIYLLTPNLEIIYIGGIKSLDTPPLGGSRAYPDLDSTVSTLQFRA